MAAPHTTPDPRPRRGAAAAALAATALTLASCGSVALFSEDPAAPRDRSSRFDRFVAELDLALNDTAPVLDQARRGVSEGAARWDPGRRAAVRRAVVESATRRLEREFDADRLDADRAVTSRVLLQDLTRLAEARERAAEPALTPWSGPLVEAPSVLSREQPRRTEGDLGGWRVALEELAQGVDPSGWQPSDTPGARDAEVALRTADLLARLEGSTGAGDREDPLLGPLQVARAALSGAAPDELPGSDLGPDLGLALQRRYAAASASAAMGAEFGASAFGALEGEARARWLTLLHGAAGMEAEPERLREIARGELDRLTVELARAAGVADADQEDILPATARLALRALRSGERPIPGARRAPRDPELLWSTLEGRVGELVAAPPPILIEADVATPYERPVGRWSSFVPGNLVPHDDPLARPPVHLAAPPGAEFLPDWLREAEALRDGIPGRAVVDAFRRAAVDVPPLLRTPTRSAFEEGWGLYAVAAAAEAGLLKEVDMGFGRIAQELCAFAAMLTDLGVNEEGWSHDQAVEFLLEVTPLPEAAVEHTTMRCFAHPGRSAMPAMGLLRLRALRRGAEGALDQRFDAASFHAALLGGGPVPMTEVDGRIQRWLEQGAPKP